MQRIRGGLLLSLGCFFSPIAAAAPCTYVAPPSGLPSRPGYTAFMSEAQLAPFRAAIPTVISARLSAALSSADTMWYDENSMVFSYQDSVEVVVGLRANCVGREVGEAHRNDSIGKLLELFGEDFRFRFPFRTAAGTDRTTNTVVINFWLPPRKPDGGVYPVRWWRESTRGRWRWVFPKGTLFGEILFQRAADTKLYPFEIRTRERYLEGWKVDVLRPFTDAKQFSQAIRAKRPDWEQNPALSRAIAHLENDGNLSAHRLSAGSFQPIFPAVTGALDVIPDLGDESLVKELLTETRFQSTEGLIWKEGNGLETYAPASAATFNIVPKGYEMGMFAVNEDSCNRCHLQTGRPIGNLIFDVILYGEIWGEDRIFTWHLFQPNPQIFGTWDDTQGSRKLNQRLVQSGLIQQGRPNGTDAIYKELPRPFKSQE